MIVREVLSPLRAAIGAALRRRSLLILLVATLGTFGLISWGTFSDIRNQRRLLDQAERGELQGFDFFQLRISMGCDETTCFVTDDQGRPLGITFPQPVQPSGEFGPKDIPPEFEALRDHIPQIVSALRRNLEDQEVGLSAMGTLLIRTRAAGTFWGVLFAALAGATLLGAEWRWGVWRTLLTHEPRRGRVLSSRFAMLWLVIAGGFVLTLGFTAGTDTIFRQMADVDAAGGPGVGTVARSAGKGLLSVEIYATLAGAFATIARTSFAGIGSLVFLLGEGLASGKYRWLRSYVPSQQVATLIPPSLTADEPGYAWWPRVTTGELVCSAPPTDQGFGEFCTEKLLPPIPQWRALMVLGVWILGAAVVAWIFVRRRDVPQ